MFQGLKLAILPGKREGEEEATKETQGQPLGEEETQGTVVS